MSVVPIGDHIPDESQILGLSSTTAKEINDGWRKALGNAVSLLTDPDVTDIRKNPQSSVLWIVRQSTGKQRSDTLKQTTPDAERMCSWIARAYGREFTWAHPVLEAILPWHGGRFSARRSPLVRGIQWSMRLHAPDVIPLDDFAMAGIATIDQIKFLRRLIDDELNILIGGEQGSGKTTLLNSLLAEVTKRRKTERIAVIEDTHEIICDAPDHYKVLADANVGWDYPQIIKSEMRHGATKLILGEIRNGASSILEAYTTGSRGNLATIHGGSKDEVMARFEIMLRRDGFPVERPAIAQAIGAVVVMRKRGVGRILREVARLTAATDKGYTFSDR
jgi:type IV secretion system protein VirB11